MKKVILSVFSLLFLLTATPSFAEGGYFDKNFNGMINGGLGYGAAIYGLSMEDEIPDVGAGQGANFSLSGMINFLFLGAELSFNRNSINDSEYDMTVGGTEFSVKTKGSGKYQAIDLKFGFLLATEANDMGYFFLYAGLRSWQGDYDMDSVSVNGVSTDDPTYLIDSETKGSGYIYGFRDFSTFSFGAFALSTRFGLWVTNAPGDSIELNGNSQDFSSSSGLGLGWEIGIGVALEDMGLAIDLYNRLDVTVTTGDLKGGGEAGAIYGSGAYILSCTYIF